MYECDEKVTAFVGGISENYQSNLIQKGLKYRWLKLMSLIARF